MKPLFPMILPLVLVACAQDNPQGATARPAASSLEAPASSMEVSRDYMRVPIRGPDDWFTGATTVTPLFDRNGISQVGAALVRFEPGARTAWHVHPLGQRLVVLEGFGRTQVDGGEMEIIRAGDVVWCPPGVRHWHGAAPDTAMLHIAIQESQDGSPVTWMEHVTDDQYRGDLE
ncbi:MAG: cupin domain-containing protein [Nitrospira sp.]|nr:cupin domain-containing protein [Nitrospira sp.]